MAHQQWRNQLDYIITLLGFSVGSGTFIKFPFYCMRNGGGAFLIPFVLFTLIGAIPCVFLEMAIGQYSQSGPIKVWDICPAFKGIGVGCVLCSWMFYTYYNVLFSWITYYFYYSFYTILPWEHCGNAWNTPDCISVDRNSTRFNITDSVPDIGNLTSNSTPGITAAEEFWRFQALEISAGLHSLGGIRWPLAGCLLVTNIILFLWIFQGIKVSGKLVYITVAVPYILVGVFLIRGSLLPGSADGMYYYIYPRFEKLKDPKVWVEACSYALYSMGVASGCIITMSGHNRINNNCFKDAIVVCLADVATTVYVGLAFFSIIGHVAYLRGVSVDAFESSGFNLAFIVYPEILASLPLPQLWSVLTFITLMTLAIDSMVPGIEIIVAAVEDQMPNLTKRQSWAVKSVVILSISLFGLIYISQGGIYVLTLVDWFVIFPSIAVFAILECVVVGWLYGTQKLQDDIDAMWGKRMPRPMALCLKYVCPLLLLVVFSYSLYAYRPPKYGDYHFPDWATVIGWMISMVSIIPIPVVFTWKVYRASGDSLAKKLKRALKPRESWARSPQEETPYNGVLEPMI